jgi:hypothetical protein
VAEYNDFSQGRYFAPKTISCVLYGIWAVLVLVNLVFLLTLSISHVSIFIFILKSVLVGTFLYNPPYTHLHWLDRNIFENRCEFNLVALIILPTSIVWREREREGGREREREREREGERE